MFLWMNEVFLHLSQVVLLVLEVHACIAKDTEHFRNLLVYLLDAFQNDHSLLEKWVLVWYLLILFYFRSKNPITYNGFPVLCAYLFWLLWLFRRGALIIRRLCVLLGAQTVYRELSSILQKEPDLDFAFIMVQVCISVHQIMYALWNFNAEKVNKL